MYFLLSDLGSMGWNTTFVEFCIDLFKYILYTYVIGVRSEPQSIWFRRDSRNVPYF